MASATSEDVVDFSRPSKEETTAWPRSRMSPTSRGRCGLRGDRVRGELKLGAKRGVFHRRALPE
jgi:hypothetical protein